MTVELVIFTGLQASGKSSFYQRHFAATHVHVSKDLLHNNRRPARRQRQLIEEALQDSCSVVVDNTNPSLEERAELIALGRDYQARVIGYVFTSSLKDALARNKERSGKARVPDIALFVTNKKLVLPTYEEGFDKIFNVRIGEGGEFEVVELTR